METSVVRNTQHAASCENKRQAVVAVTHETAQKQARTGRAGVGVGITVTGTHETSQTVTHETAHKKSENRAGGRAGIGVGIAVTVTHEPAKT